MGKVPEKNNLAPKCHQGALGNLERDIEDLKIRKEIEDANRICVLAGDFFMATASTQLAEIENQLVVKQISKE